MYITQHPLVAMKPASTTRSPTQEVYGELQSAFDHFNRHLFRRVLPPCVITLGRGRRTFGYYAATRFSNAAGEITDEISMNPAHFRRPIIEVMATLVHEMVHHWQHHFGRPSRSGYHNREWAGEMLRLGLHPSDTGKPGGRMRGQMMREYVIRGGRFEVAAEKLLAGSFGISWFELEATVLLPKGLENLGVLGVPVRGASGQRVKFTCPGCGAKAWGKASLYLICGRCERPMEPSGW